MEKITVVIPVYNGENYIVKCIDSVLNQTYKNLEIIIVNDGSTDKTKGILEKYVNNNSRIKIFEQSNKGISAARNLGIDHTKTNYITFIDSDDWIESDMIELLYRNIVKYNSEISACGYYLDFQNNVKEINADATIHNFTKKEALTRILFDEEIKSHPWGRLYRTSLFKNLRFPVGRIYEDYALLYLLVNEGENFVLEKVPKYHYVQHSASLSNDFTPQKEFDLLLGLLERHQFVLENESSIDEVKLFKNISSKKIFTTIKNIVRSKKSNEMMNEMEIVFEKLQWLIDNSKDVKFFNLLKLQLFKRFPIQYSAFLMMTKKNKKKENKLF